MVTATSKSHLTGFKNTQGIPVWTWRPAETPPCELSSRGWVTLLASPPGSWSSVAASKWLRLTSIYLWRVLLSLSVAWTHLKHGPESSTFKRHHTHGVSFELACKTCEKASKLLTLIVATLTRAGWWTTNQNIIEISIKTKLLNNSYYRISIYRSNLLYWMHMLFLDLMNSWNIQEVLWMRI
jgi:hypothetical protein